MQRWQKRFLLGLSVVIGWVILWFIPILLMPSMVKPVAGAALALQATATPTLIPTRPPSAPVPLFMPVLFRDYRPQAPILGVALQGFNNASGLAQTLALNARWGRRWVEIAWRDVEPKEGEFHWEVLAGLEEELLRARTVGIESILEIQLTPEWAQKYPPSACGPIRSDRFDAFANFLEQLVQRYGTKTQYRARYWQLGNEADVDYRILAPDSIFGCWGEQEDAFYGGGHYGEMLKVVYPRIKAADPGAFVMMSGLLLECDPYTMQVGVECRNEERWKSGFFLEGVLKAGAGNYFDMLDVHSYGDLRMDLPSRMHSIYSWSGPNGGTGLPEKVAFVRGVLNRYGQANKPIFAGEIALKCEEAGTDCEQVGAAFIPRVYAEAYGLGLVGASYYALISDFKYKGLLNEDLSAKPQYIAYRFMASQLSHVEHVGSVSDYPGISGQLFKRSGIRRLQIVWSTTGNPISITLPADFLAAYDRFGQLIQPSAGKVTVDWSPIYVELKYRNQ